jgi:tetratricopeptide (TPR) repeat protein
MKKISKLFWVLVVVVLLSNSGCVARWLAHRRSIDHYVTAMALRSGNFNEDAVLELQEAVNLNNQFGLAHSMLGDIYRESGQPEKAAEAYENACQLDPWSFSDHFHLGEVYQVLERFSEAVEVLKRACQLQPDHIESNYSLGMCYYEMQEYKQAEKFCTRASELDPQNEEIFASLGNIYSKTGSDYKAINAYKQALEVKADQPKVMVELGMVYIRMKRYGPGRLILEKAVELAPDYVDAHVALAFCLLKQNEYKSALLQYKYCLLLDEENCEALNGVGVVFMLLYMENPEDKKLATDAIESWHRSLEIKPNQPKIEKLVQRYVKEFQSDDQTDSLMPDGQDVTN